MSGLSASAKSKRVLVPLDLPPPRPTVARRGVQILGGQTMGTTWSVKWVGSSRALDLRRSIEQALARIIAQMSPWEPASDISRFNYAAAGTWHKLPPEFATVLQCALRLAEQSGGAYDPTVGPLVNLWGFGPEAAFNRVPPAADITSAHERCGWQRIRFEASDLRVFQPGGVHLDLSSIAKGYAVDCVAAVLKGAGIDSFLVEIGGELRGEGIKSDGLPWWVALERPPTDTASEDSDEVQTVVALCGLSIATSGSYRRFFAADGRSYSHTIDPRTGYPVPHGLVSVTVLDPECMRADALATTLTVLGPEEGMAFAKREKIAAAFVCVSDDGMREDVTPSFAAMLD